MLFIDASALGQADSRTHSYLTDEDIQRIAATYHSWRSRVGDYSDVPGFCASVSLARIREKGYSLFPARYIAVDKKSIPHDALRNSDSFSVLVRRYRTTLNKLDKKLAMLSETLNGIERTSKPPMRAAMIKVPLSEVLDRSDERLGDSPEPEILTCTERAGLTGC